MERGFIMKRMYEQPRAYEEKFTANEYVAACITGMIQCAYPGNGQTNGQTNRFDDYNGKESGYWTDAAGKLHGLCGYDAKISFNEDTGSGYEYIGNKIQRNRPIHDISGYKPVAGTYYDVKWKSDDLENKSGTYSHIGRLVITDIDSHRPNHS